jgi:hypothetical protein
VVVLEPDRRAGGISVEPEEIATAPLTHRKMMTDAINYSGLRVTFLIARPSPRVACERLARDDDHMASLNPSARKNALGAVDIPHHDGAMIEVLQHGLILPGRPGGADSRCRADYR